MDFWQYHGNKPKFQGLLLKDNKQASYFNILIRGQEIEHSKSITALCIWIDENVTSDEHVNNICFSYMVHIYGIRYHLL